MREDHEKFLQAMSPSTTSEYLRPYDKAEGVG